MKKYHLFIVVLICGVMLAAAAAVVRSATTSVTPNATPDFQNVRGASQILTQAPTENAKVATAAAGLPMSTPSANSMTRTAAARPLPTCISFAPAAASAAASLVPSSAYPNDPIPAMRATAVASQIAGRARYVPVSTIDTAPSVSMQDKWVVDIGHTDCTATQYFVASDNINAFVANVKSGDVVVNIFPPPSAPRHPVLTIVPTSTLPPGTPVPSPRP